MLRLMPNPGNPDAQAGASGRRPRHTRPSRAAGSFFDPTRKIARRSRLSGAGSASAWQSGHPYRGQSHATKLPARRKAAPHLQSVYEMSADAPGLRPGPEQRALSGCHARRQRPAGERTILRACPTDGLNSIDKDSLKIRELEHVLIRKSRATFLGHALDHDGFGLNQSKS